ncbi:MAG TPA: serine hydrolase domain-containing protein, partial [Gemmatimonadales bacterium]|nr:serine hydrolase domain-containing protein [Gemmatimonadales bacterium]
HLVYSNLGYNVAAMVIDATQPEGWRHYLDSAVYRPAGLGDTYARVSGLDRRRIAMPHELHPDGSFTTATFFKTDATMNSAGGHLATLHDLARWVVVQMDGGILDGRRVFPAPVVALSHRMIAPQTVAASKRFTYFDRAGWGAGWDLGGYAGEPMVSRFGSYSSIRSHLSFLPGDGSGWSRRSMAAWGSPPIWWQLSPTTSRRADRTRAGPPSSGWRSWWPGSAMPAVRWRRAIRYAPRGNGR